MREEFARLSFTLFDVLNGNDNAYNFQRNPYENTVVSNSSTNLFIHDSNGPSVGVGLKLFLSNEMEQSDEFEQMKEEKPLDLAETSRLNKILHAGLAETQNGTIDVNLRNDPRSPLYSNQTFESLKLKKPLIDAIYEMGFEQPSKIQEAALPLLLGNPPKDLLAQSQSGTGKTAAFLLTMLQRLDPNAPYPQCICLAPTFELALQIGEVARKMAKYLQKVKIRILVKGEIAQSNVQLTEQLIIATPGKLSDFLLKYRVIDAKNIICFVVDEADIMLMQQGYRDISIRIHNEIIQSNPTCQCMLFSATFSPEVYTFAESLVPDIAAITLRRTDQSLPNIKQFMIKCGTRDEKYKAIINLYNTLSIASSIIFCYTRSSVDWLTQQIRRTGRKVGILHGQMSPEEREDAIRQFREGKHRVLITTNVSSRGLDIPHVKLVVNYDPCVTFEPSDYDTYLHRIGRTGRFGKRGIAVNLVDSPKTIEYVRAFEEHFGRKIEVLEYDDYERLEELDKQT
ncbi:RNA helicase [Aphelenchoides besseyi]|nr:RNA helicase [Aphelenchoides besseyi]